MPHQTNALSRRNKFTYGRVIIKEWLKFGGSLKLPTCYSLAAWMAVQRFDISQRPSKTGICNYIVTISIKIWEVYKDRRCVRTYFGHRQAVRDVNFNNSGDKFLSAAYDRYIKLWDTETGQVVSRFTNKKVPYCVKFNPDEDKQHLFVAGMADKKIVCVSL